MGTTLPPSDHMAISAEKHENVYGFHQHDLDCWINNNRQYPSEYSVETINSFLPARNLNNTEGTVEVLDSSSSNTSSTANEHKEAAIDDDSVKPTEVKQDEIDNVPTIATVSTTTTHTGNVQVGSTTGNTLVNLDSLLTQSELRIADMGRSVHRRHQETYDEVGFSLGGIQNSKFNDVYSYVNECLLLPVNQLSMK